VRNYDAATQVPSKVDIAVVGLIIGRLDAHEKDLTNAIAIMWNRRQMRRRAECLKLLSWMEHMHFDASSRNMKEDTRQWTSVVDSLCPDVPVAYNDVTGLPMKFSANALELLLDMVVDRLRGTTHDGGAGTTRMDRLRKAPAPFTGELECATRRYAACISAVHAGSFSQQAPLLGDTPERNTAPPVLPPLAPPPTLPQVHPSLGAPFGQASWADQQKARGIVTVVPTTSAPPTDAGVDSTLSDDDHVDMSLLDE
jgi:hypothetical protein